MARLDLTDELAGRLVAYHHRAREAGRSDNATMTSRTIKWYEREFGFKLIKRTDQNKLLTAQLEFETEAGITAFLLKL